MIHRLVKTVENIDISQLIDSPYSYNGRPVPRVSDILKNCINEDYIAIWANSLGLRRKSYKEELERLADIGTAVHESIERFFKFGIESDNIGFRGFKDWWNVINQNNVVKVIASEETIVCPYFGGTIDCILEINGKNYIVDFKTSNNITIKHFLQLAAYRYMVATQKGLKIDGLIILQLNKKKQAFGEYLVDFNNPEGLHFMYDCTDTFLAMAYQYHNYINCTRKFGEIFDYKRRRL